MNRRSNDPNSGGTWDKAGRVKGHQEDSIQRCRRDGLIRVSKGRIGTRMKPKRRAVEAQEKVIEIISGHKTEKAGQRTYLKFLILKCARHDSNVRPFAS